MEAKIEYQFPNVWVPCCMGVDDCVCGKDERVLRAYVADHVTLQPMTPKQREWCLSEIASVEGYVRGDYESVPDRELARGVLSAWTDYCRDKGLL